MHIKHVSGGSVNRSHKPFVNPNAQSGQYFKWLSFSTTTMRLLPVRPVNVTIKRRVRGFSLSVNSLSRASSANL